MVLAVLLPGCGLFIMYEQDEPAPLSAALRADRYQMFRAPSWADQTTLRVLAIGGTPPYSYDWTVVDPAGRILDECLDSPTGNVARFTAKGSDGAYTVRCIVRDSRENYYSANTVLQVGGDIGLDITTPRSGVRAGGGPHGQTTLHVNPKFGVPPFEVSWICTGPDGRIDNERLDVSDPLVPRFTSCDQVGQYLLTATIVDAGGQTATQSFVIVVGQDLGVDVAAERTTVLPGGGAAGMTQLLATPVGGIEPYLYDWEIVGPDGSNCTDLLWDNRAQAPLFESDEQTGSFLARCAVTDGAGTVLIGSANLTVGEQVTVNVTADRLALPVGAESGQQARLLADVRGGHQGVTLAWTVSGPDGEDASHLLSSSSEESTTFTPGDLPGSYVVRCVAVDGQEFSAADSVTLFVGGTLGIVVSTSNQWPATGGIVPTGTALLTSRVYGGVPPHSYSWQVADPAGENDPDRLDDPASAAPTFTSSLLAGRYFVSCTVTDSAGEVTADGLLLNVGQPLNVDVSVDKQSLTGGGGVSGQAQLVTTLHGGVAPYTYEWSIFGPDNTPEPQRLSSTQVAAPVFTSSLTLGTYRASLTTTDAMGVVFVDSVEIVVGSTGGGAEGQNLSGSVTADRQTIGTGGETAQASILTIGGVAPLSYWWQVTDPAGNPADHYLDSTTADTVIFSSDAVQGTYRLRCTVSDAVGNAFADSLQLVVNDEFHVNLSGSDTYIVPGGSVNLLVDRTGGSAPFTYSWSCVNAAGNPAGQFAVGSTGTGTALTAGVDDVTNIWQAPPGIAAMGAYRLTLTAVDSLGRSFTDSITITLNDSMIVQLTADRVHVLPGQAISLNADRTGGSPNSTYAWTSRNVSGTLAGSFTTGSTGTGSATQAAADDVTNTWTAPNAGLGVLGTYRVGVTATDENGISSTDTIMVIVDDPFSLDVRATDAFILPGGSTILTADRSGGQRNFRFVWTARSSAGALSGSFFNGSTGTGMATQSNRTNDTTNTWTAPPGIVDVYKITCVATDALGRSFTDTTEVRVGAADALALSVDADTVYLQPGQTVNLAANPLNGVANLDYSWSAIDQAGLPAGTLGATMQGPLPGATTNTWTAPAIDAGVLGTYRIAAIVTDSAGRQADDTVHVVVHSPLSLDVRAGQVHVIPSSLVSLSAQPVGGEPPFEYLWQAFDVSDQPAGDFAAGLTAPGQALQSAEPDAVTNSWAVADEGAYIIVCTVTDNAGQVFEDSVTLTVSTQQTLLLDLTVSELALTPGESVNLSAKRVGGTANYNYAWSAVDGAGLPAGTLGLVSQNGLPGDALNTWTAPSADGSYVITCTVMDARGLLSADSTIVRVSSLAIQNIFLAPAASDTQSVLPPLNLTWTAQGADPGKQYFAAQGLVSPAHPRNLVVTIEDQDNLISGGRVRISGRDARGYPQSEVLTIPASSGGFSTSIGKLPFAAVERVDAYEFTGIISVFVNPDTISLGVGNKFGLTGLLRVPADVPYVYEGNNVLTTGFTLDLTSGEQGINFASAPNGTRNYIVVFRAR